MILPFLMVLEFGCWVWESKCALKYTLYISNILQFLFQCNVLGHVSLHCLQIYVVWRLLCKCMFHFLSRSLGFAKFTLSIEELESLVHYFLMYLDVITFKLMHIKLLFGFFNSYICFTFFSSFSLWIAPLLWVYICVFLVISSSMSHIY